MNRQLAGAQAACLLGEMFHHQVLHQGSPVQGVFAFSGAPCYSGAFLACVCVFQVPLVIPEPS